MISWEDFYTIETRKSKNGWGLKRYVLVCKQTKQTEAEVAAWTSSGTSYTNSLREMVRIAECIISRKLREADSILLDTE
jgi:hypothetical protein